MAENKQYINQDLENGAVLISEDVIATIVSHAVNEVEGVAGLSNASIINRYKSIRVTISECNIIVVYGQSVFDAAKAVQKSISNAIQAMTGIEAESINVNVTGIIRK